MLRNFACSICPREFTTASSLGGHMRDHQRKGHLNVRNPAAASASAASSSGCHGKGKAVARPFDLRINERKTYTNFIDIDAAISLIMISCNMEGGGEEDDVFDDEDYNEKEETAGHRRHCRRRRCVCCECGMVFYSYQALGGHRAGHTKVGGGRRENGGRDYAGGKKINAAKK